MKYAYIAGAAAALSVAGPALAQSSNFSPVTAYGTIGYSYMDGKDQDYGAVTGRVGARFGKYLGVEGEVSSGVKGDSLNVDGTNVKTHEQSQVAAYAVGFLPLSQNLDLFARAGYGDTVIHAKADAVSIDDGNSWNYGAGAQYTFDGHNGVRGEYTRYDYLHGGQSADVWSLGYVHKF